MILSIVPFVSGHWASCTFGPVLCNGDDNKKPQ